MSMGVWITIAIFVVGLILVHALLYRYFEAERESVVGRGASQPERPGSSERTEPRRGTTSTSHRSVEAHELAVPPGGWIGAPPIQRMVDGCCPHCGVENDPDPAFTFCRNCAGRLR